MQKKLIILPVILALVFTAISVNLVQSAEAPNVTITVKNSSGEVLGDALVTFYDDFARAIISDNLLQAGANDASGDTLAGSFTIKLNPGTYEYVIQRLSYNSYYGTVELTGDAKTLNITLNRSSSSILSTQRSGFSVTETAPAGDGVAFTTVEAFARTDDNSTLNGRTVTMISSRGSIDVFDSNPKTTIINGRVQFTLKSSVPGKAKIYALIDGARVATNSLITFTGTAAPDASKSSVSLSASSTPTAAPVTLTVTVRSLANDPLSGRSVEVTSNRAEDTITTLSSTTDASGHATFSVSSSKAGTATLTVKSGSITLGTAMLEFTAPAPASPLPALPTGVQVGDLVKSSENPAVYYVGRDGKRHSFPNEKTYFTWYGDFSSVKTISAADLASLALGKNVTYKPGARMIKLQTVPKVYAVGRGSVLRWVQTEALATALYGSGWNKKIDDLSDAFFINYTEGAVIDEISDFSPTSEGLSQTINDALSL